MKKTFTININGLVYTIDEDAYEKLQWYLNTLSLHFGKGDEGREIVSDIEARIAELFKDKVRDSKQVINIEDVDEVIKVLGQPEELFDQEAEQKSATKGEEPQKEKFKEEDGYVRKRVYRDPDNRILGGVCSGISEYFNLDPIILRFVFAIMFFVYGTGLLLYIILWIIIPKAKTTAQKLEMKGEPVTVSNIEKSIREEYDNVKTNFKEMRKKGYYRKSGDFFEKLATFLGQILYFGARVFGIIIGICLLIGGLIGLIACISVVSFGGQFINEGHSFIPHVAAFFSSPLSYSLFVICILLIAGIPLLMIAYLGARLVFNFNAKHKLIGLTALAAWILGLVLIIPLAFQEFGSINSRGSSTSKIDLDQITSDTIEVRLLDSHLEYEANFHMGRGNTFVITEDSRIYGMVHLDVEPSKNNIYELLTIKESKGKNRKEAEDLAENIQIPFKQLRSEIQISEYFEIPRKHSWKEQNVYLTLYIPEGKYIKFDREVEDILNDIENNEMMDDDEMVGKLWKMGKNELVLVK